MQERHRCTVVQRQRFVEQLVGPLLQGGGGWPSVVGHEDVRTAQAAATPPARCGRDVGHDGRDRAIDTRQGRDLLGGLFEFLAVAPIDHHVHAFLRECVGTGSTEPWLDAHTIAQRPAIPRSIRQN